MLAEIARASGSDARPAEAQNKTVVTHARKALISEVTSAVQTRLSSPGPPGCRTWAIDHAPLPPHTRLAPAVQVRMGIKLDLPVVVHSREPAQAISANIGSYSDGKPAHRAVSE